MSPDQEGTSDFVRDVQNEEAPVSILKADILQTMNEILVSTCSFWGICQPSEKFVANEMNIEDVKKTEICHVQPLQDCCLVIHDDIQRYNEKNWH